MSDIRILMVDDHSLFRESLSRYLHAASGLQVVGECTTVSEALAALARIETDVVLLDYDLGVELGTSLLTNLKQSRKQTKVLVVTAGISDATTRLFMETGASGVFLKHNSLDRLLSAIERVANGEIWLDQEMVRAIVARNNASKESHEVARPLTSRQSEVMRGILDGRTNKEIALDLKVSESSVKAVIQELFQKAGVRTRSQLVRIAIERHASDWLKPPA